MGLTYTRSEIRTRVNDITRDTDTGQVKAAVKNRIINDVYRDFVQRTRCNRNVIIFSLADASSDGVLEYDRNGNTPTITRVDVENQNHYTISSCERIDYMGRWVGTASNDDGGFKEMRPANQHIIDTHTLLSYTTDRPLWFQQLDTPGTLRILPALDTNGYPYKFEVRYREAITDLITDDSDPTASGDESLVPSIPLEYRPRLISGIVAEIYKLRTDGRWRAYGEAYEAGVAMVRSEIQKTNSAQALPIRLNYRGLGG